MSYNKKEFQRLNGVFTDTSATLLDNENPTLNDFESVLDAYNALIVYSEIDYDRKRNSTKEFINSTIGVNRITLQRCFEKLNLPIILPAKLLSAIHYLPPHNITETVSIYTSTSNLLENQDTSTSTSNLILNQNVSTSTSNLNPYEQNSSTMPNSNATQNPSDDSTNPSQAAVKQSVDKFIKYTGNILNYKYSGDPLELNSFIADARMLYKLAKSDETKDFCFDYIKNRLKGRAAEAIPDDCDSLECLIKALKEKIKPDNSSIIEGRILALQLKNNDYSKFSADAEKLSEALRRTLVVEGITKAKAEELAIKKMVELCRKTTTFEIVKSVLESTKFSTPAEVLAQFITQSDKARLERKEQQLKNANKQNFKNGNNDNRNKRYNNNNRNGNNSNANQNNNRSNNQNGYRQNRGQNQNQPQNRGRSNFSNNRSNRNEQTIRLIAGSPIPATAEQPQAPQQQAPTQFFRLEN